MAQNTVNKRKKPSQARANATVDTLLEATAQILERGDQARFTTNHIAEHAGYSVGTLYGYFQNKRSLLHAIALREIARQERELLAALSGVADCQSDEDVIRIIVHAALRPFGNRGQLRIAMMQQIIGDAEIMAATEMAQNNVVDAFLGVMSMRHQRGIELDSDGRFTLLASIAGAMHSAVTSRPDVFGSPRFEDDIIVIVQGFLAHRMKRHV
jgi:AcrR family transcriptional regulator